MSELLVSRTVRFGSSPLAFAPNIFRWAINAYQIHSQRKAARNVINSWDHGMTSKQVDDVLCGNIPILVEGETVVVNV